MWLTDPMTDIQDTTERYNFRAVEAKWRRIWEERGCFTATEKPGEKKCYTLEMFAYPSGLMHMGHAKNSLLVDMFARTRRAQGFNVLRADGLGRVRLRRRKMRRWNAASTRLDMDTRQHRSRCARTVQIDWLCH